jgi:hypothetical protein
MTGTLLARIDPSPLFSREATWVYIQTGNSKVLFAAVNKSGNCAKGNADIINLLGIKNVSIGT